MGEDQIKRKKEREERIERKEYEKNGGIERRGEK